MSSSASHGLVAMRDVLACLPAAAAYLTGPDLIIDCANDACRRLAGDREVTGRPLRDALPELAALGRLRLIGQVLRTGQPARGSQAELRVRRPGGKTEQVYVDWVCQPVRDAAGAVSGALLHATDVTDRLRLNAMSKELAAAQEWQQTMFDAMPQGVMQCAADGSVIEANLAASEILGIDPTDLTSWPSPPAQRAVHEDGSPYQPEDLPVAVALRTGKVVTEAVMGLPDSRTGELHWMRVTAVPDAWDREGRPQRAYALFVDLTQQRRAEAALQESTSLLDRLRQANVLGVVASSEQGAYEANDAFLDIIGYSREDLAAGRISRQSLTPGNLAARDEVAHEQLVATGAFQPYEKEYVHRDGYRVPVLVGGAVVERDPLRWVTFVVDLTARQRAEDDRAELVAGQQAARAEADGVRERLTFLLRAGAFVAAARRPQELLEHAAQMVVPTLADHCVVFLPGDDGMLHGISLAHKDPARAVVLAGFRNHKIPISGPMAIQAAYTTGVSQLLRDAEATLPHWRELAPELGETLARLRADSVLATPLMAGQRPLGVLALARDADRPPFSGTDVAVVEEFARRLAVSLANADTFAREHTIAETLQRSVLPGTLPDIAGLEVAVCYLPATEGADVGGDWYDAFHLNRNRVGLVIGDVTGHSIMSASIMGQVRSILRAYAIHHPDPSDVLRRTNAALARLLPDATATAVFAVLDLTSGGLAYANAGHPPPLLAQGAGQAGYLDDAPGVMLGACPDTSYPVRRRRLRPGAGLLLYTDGLIEDRSRDISEGLSALAIAAKQPGIKSAGQLCSAAQSVLPGEGPRPDDVCLLAVRFVAPQPVPG